MTRLSLSKKISLGAMTAALTVLSLYAASVLPWSKITCCFLSSLFIYVLVNEGVYGFAILTFFASAGVAFLLLPDKNVCFLYIALLGHYGIFKTFIERRLKDKVLRFIFKLFYCDAFTLLAVFLYCVIFKLELAGFLPSWNLWLIVGALQLIFIAYDLLYSLCRRFYDAVIRNAILPRR